METEGKVVEDEGEGIGDVILRLRCTPKAVCSLNSELEDFNSVSLVLKYKPFVTDRHLVRGHVESWILEMKAFKIDLREVPFLLYDVCLLYTSPSPRDGLLSRMPSSA